MLFYKHLEVEKDKRIFVFGDTHGSYHLIKKAKNALGIREEDIKIFLGDLTDRGKENFLCVMEATRTKNAYTVRGNHDDMMIRGLLEGDSQQYHGWVQNGGNTVLEEVGEEGATLLATILDEVAPIVLTVERGEKSYGFVHGGYPSILEYVPIQMLEQVIKEQYPENTTKALRSIADALVWDRDMVDCAKEGYKLPRVGGVDYVFHGHTYVEGPLMNANRVYIDTGGVFNGNLTVAVIEADGEMWFYSTLEED